MAVQLIRKVRDKQPTKFVGVDWSNPNLASFYYIAISGGMGLGSVVWVDRKNRVYNCTAKTGKSTSAGLGGFYTGSNSGSITGSASLPNNSRSLWLFGNSAGSGDVVEATIANASGTQISIKNGVLTGSIRTYDGTFSTSTINKTGVLSAFLTWNQPNNIGTLYVGKETPITVATTSTWDVNNNLVSVFSAQESSVILGGIATGVLPASVRLSLSENPWQIFEPETIPLFYSTVTAQYSRPTSDVSTGTWTASSGSDLFAMLDETSASDADYIVTTGASTCEVALGSLSDPSSSSGHVVRYRISADSGGITVRLRQGTTTIATWTHASAPTSLTTYAQTLTSGEADSITDYAALKLQFEATE